MINKYSISNFKIHKEGYIFGLNGLTILTGTNNSGKSSVVQSLRLLSKINGSVSRYTRLPFEDVRELKDFKRTLNKDVSRSESIKYKFSLNIEEFKFCNIELEFESIYNFRIPFKEIIDQAILKRVDIYFENNDGLIKNYELVRIDYIFEYKINTMPVSTMLNRSPHYTFSLFNQKSLQTVIKSNFKTRYQR